MIDPASIRHRNGRNVKQAVTAAKLGLTLLFQGICSVPVSRPFAPYPDAPIGHLERRAVSEYGLVVRQDGSTAPVKLTDLSDNGCGLETSAELQPDERIMLSIHRRAAIAASVRWCADGRAGVSFDAAPPAQQRSSRKSERTSLTADVALRRPGSANFRARVLDVSTCGCRLDVVDRPNVDERVWIKFDGLESIESTVCWVAGFKVGLQFASPIHPAVFDQLLSRFNAGSANR